MRRDAISLRFQRFMYLFTISRKRAAHVFTKYQLWRMQCFIAGWFRTGRECRWSKVLVVNAQRQGDDNLRHLDSGRSAGLKKIVILNFLRA